MASISFSLPDSDSDSCFYFYPDVFHFQDDEEQYQARWRYLQPKKRYRLAVLKGELTQVFLVALWNRENKRIFWLR